MICEHYAANSALDLLSLPPFYLSTCVFMTRKKKQWEVCKYAFRRDKKYLHWIPNDFTDGFRFGLRGETKPLPLCDLHKNPQVGGWMKHFETKWKSLLKFPGYRTKSFLVKFVILQVVFFISMYPGTELLLETGKGNLFEEQRNIQKQFTKYLVILLLLYLMGQCLRRNWGFIQNKKRKLQSNLLSIFIVWKNYYSPSFQQMNKTFHYSKVWKCATKYLSTSVALQFSSVHLTRKRGGAVAFTSMSMGSRVHRRLCMWLK